MFPEFQKKYVATSRGGANIPMTTAFVPEIIKPQGDVMKFLSEYQGTTFNRGLYRVLSSRTTEKWSHLIAAGFPDYADRIWPFACDWLGRMFVLDNERIINGNPLILMMEPGTGEALQVPADFREFHEKILIDDADAAVAVDAFEEWMMIHPTDLRLDQCIGYITPLFLGGKDEPENFETSDLEVYWGICAQLLQRTRHLPHGAKIGTVNL
jgi:hypothetical protein